MKNAENKASYPYDERKTRKITLRKGTMNRETAKNGFPSRGKRRKQRKMNFSHGGKEVNSGKRISLTGENKETAKNGFPSRGKRSKQRKTDFPREGKPKISENWLSLMGEKKETAKNGFPSRGKTRK